MLQSFKKFVQKEKLFRADDKILLAVSGGVDSVVMCELFHQAGFNFGVAHCNFGLRGLESDEDEQFVKALSGKYGVGFHAERFETEIYAKENGVSIQMAARELRYNWFEKLRKTKNYDCIAVAHHKDDEIETFLINLIRGTGIAGFHGIHPKNNFIVRPLMFTTKNEIEKFAQKVKLSFRNDSSNQELKYKRNKIRHSIIPILKEINPNLEETIAQNIGKIRDVEQIYRDHISEKRKEVVTERGENAVMLIEKLKALTPLQTYLFEFLNSYNFGSTIIDDIISSLDGISGKQFFSSTHRLLKNRDELIITKLVDTEEAEREIPEGQRVIDYPLKMKMNQIANNTDFEIPENEHIASLDYDKLKFPLKLRKWKKGDAFFPLGMNSSKKLSDFFIDNKVPINEKENIFVIESEGKIIWIVGHRIDNRYKITETTENIYLVELL